MEISNIIFHTSDFKPLYFLWTEIKGELLKLNCSLVLALPHNFGITVLYS